MSYSVMIIVYPVNMSAIDGDRRRVGSGNTNKMKGHSPTIIIGTRNAVTLNPVNIGIGGCNQKCTGHGYSYCSHYPANRTTPQIPTNIPTARQLRRQSSAEEAFHPGNCIACGSKWARICSFWAEGSVRRDLAADADDGPVANSKREQTRSWAAMCAGGSPPTRGVESAEAPWPLSWEPHCPQKLCSARLGAPQDAHCTASTSGLPQRAQNRASLSFLRAHDAHRIGSPVSSSAFSATGV